MKAPYKRGWNDLVVLQEYIHIDNGGYTFSFIRSENWYSVEMSNSFHGYCENTTKMFSGIRPEQLRKIGNFFILAAQKAEETKAENDNA